MQIDSAAASCTGAIKSINEDVVYLDGDYSNGDNCIVSRINDRLTHHFAVFDGISGLGNSREAALFIAEKLVGEKSAGDTSVFLINSNSLLCRETEFKLGRMGCTAVILTISAGMASVCNVGDSRAYVLNGNGLRQLSKDHTRVQQMIDAGIISENQRQNSPFGHELTQWMGDNKEQYEISPYVSDTVTAYEGDLFLICSDGLYDMVDDKQIELILSENEPPDVLARKLVIEAKNSGGIDDISVVVVKVKSNE